MAKYFRTGILIVLNISVLLLFNACHKKTNVQNVTDFFDELDQNKLNASLQKSIAELKSKKTVFGLKINKPDTLLAFLSDPDDFSSFKEKCATALPFTILKQVDSIARNNGLESDYYNFASIQKLQSGLFAGKWKKDPEKYSDSIALLMILTADALSSVYSDLGVGRTSPEVIGNLQFLNRRKAMGRLKFLAQSNYLELIQNAVPKNKYYNAVKNEFVNIEKYKDSIKGDLPVLNKLSVNDAITKKTIRNICYRLKIKNCLEMPDSSINKLNKVPENVISAIEKYQRLCDFELTGKLDKTTSSSLNFNISETEIKLKSSLERLRWCEIKESPNAIFVNIASNMLMGFRNDSLIIEMRVCTGESQGKRFYELLEKSKEKGRSDLAPVSHETPIIQSEINYYTINPKWTVPTSILIKEMMGTVRNNPAALAKMGYTLQDFKGKIIDPSSIDWKTFNPNRPNFRLVQNAGDGNALGKLIIHFNNPFSIYMHDTPSKWAFSSANRNVSHGCVRLEKPFDLLEFIASIDNEKRWFDQALITAGLPPKQDSALLRKWKKSQKDTSTKKEFIADKSNSFKKKIPVNILYLTAYPYKNSIIKYAPDPYGEDKSLLKSMEL